MLNTYNAPNKQYQVMSHLSIFHPALVPTMFSSSRSNSQQINRKIIIQNHK